MNPYVSIDIETTGLDEEVCQVIEVAAVVDDWVTPLDELPTFSQIIDPGVIVGQPYALQMNAAILLEIANGNGHEADETVYDMAMFIRGELDLNYDDVMEPVKFTAAGKNYAGFDKQFLKRLPGWYDHMKDGHRVLDPGNLYYNPLTDERPPDTAECMRRAGMGGVVTHRAVEDALVVCELIRRRFGIATGV